MLGGRQPPPPNLLFLKASDVNRTQTNDAPTRQTLALCTMTLYLNALTLSLLTLTSKRFSKRKLLTGLGVVVGFGDE
jgi:hypothetical protein